MRVLSVTWGIHDDNIQGLATNLTGAGIVIHNICECIGRRCDSYVMIGNTAMKADKSGNIQYLANNLESLTEKDNEKRLNLLIEGFNKNVELIKPDIINFHGTGDFIFNCIKICIKREIKYVVTIHLYIEKKLNIPGTEKAKKYLSDIFSLPTVNVMAVGNGMREKILTDFPHVGKDNIYVIANGTDYIAVRSDESIKRKLGIENKKILILAGTINARKNQLQVVEAYKLLSDDLKCKIAVVFCGKDSLDGRLQEAIDTSGYKHMLHYVGAIPATDMYKYYSIADGYIMPSLAEGLSIACLEALRYGIPQIMFKDSECAEDLSDPKVCVLAEERSSEALSRAIERWYDTNWDMEYIKRYSQYFSMERVADDYIEYYKNVLASNT